MSVYPRASRASCHWLSVPPVVLTPKEEFCDTGCQSNCGPSPTPNGGYGGDVRNKAVGYFASWVLQNRGCNRRGIEDIPLDSLTHINVAFGFIDPDSFEIYPIRGATIAGFQDITSLKQKAPGIRVWLALGGMFQIDTPRPSQNCTDPTE